MKRLVSLLITLIMLLMSFGNVFAIELLQDAQKTVSLLDGISLSAKVTNINDNGNNLNNAYKDVNCDISDSRATVVTTAFVENEKIYIKGEIDSKPFSVSGDFCSISENGCVYVFDTTDHLGNYRVVFCSVEKEIENSALYFKSDSIKEYHVVTKLYLAPRISKSKDYIMIELYGNNIPVISQKTIDSLPEEHELHQWWYVKEFKPVSVETESESITTRAGTVAYGMLESYTYNASGIIMKHYMRYYEDCDVSDMSTNQSNTSSATIRISDKWIESDVANACSSDSSALRLVDVAVTFSTSSNIAVTQMWTSGTVDEAGSIAVNFDCSFGIGAGGLTGTPTLNFTWHLRNTSQTVSGYSPHTNSPDNGYWREATTVLASNQRLQQVGNHLINHWAHKDYGGVASTGSVSIIFEYRVDNVLDYTQGHSEVDTRNFTVNIS